MRVISNRSEGQRQRVRVRLGFVPRRIYHDDASRHFDVPRELYFHRRRGADRPLARRNEPVRVDHESRCVSGRSPEGDNAVLPLRQAQPGVSLQRPTGGRRRGSDGLDLRVVGCQLQDRVTPRGDVQGLRPLIGLAVKRDRLVRLHRVVSWAKAHVDGTVQRRDDSARRHSRWIVADEQRMARHRRCPPLGVHQDDLDMKDAYHLDGGRPRDGRKNRRKDQRADHQRHRRRVKTGCQQLCGHLAIRDRDASGQHHCEARALGQRVNRPVNQGAIGFLHVGPVL